MISIRSCRSAKLNCALRRNDPDIIDTIVMITVREFIAGVNCEQIRMVPDLCKYR